VTLVQMGNEGGIEASIRSFLTISLAPMVSNTEMDQIGPFLDRVVPLFPSFATLSWLVMLTANAALAQSLLTKWGAALRAAPDYTQVAAPEWSYWLVVGAAGLKILTTGEFEYLFQNLVLILAAPFFFVGLAVAHVLVRRTRFPGAGLAAFYMLLMVFTWFGALVAAVGFLEPWTRLRDRFRPVPAALAPYREPNNEE
jgi:hypothetical protein